MAAVVQWTCGKPGVPFELRCTFCKCVVHPLSHGCGMAAGAMEKGLEGIIWCTTCWQSKVDKEDKEVVARDGLRRKELA